MDLSIFRKYDIRGIVPKQINAEAIYKIARDLDKVFKKEGPIIVGRDVRKTSRNLKDILIMGLKVAGFNVVDVGIITTPMLAFLVGIKDVVGGAIITASHNPPNFNGIKIIKKDGMEDISGKDVLKSIGLENLKKSVNISKMLSAPANFENPTGVGVDIKDKYIDKYVRFLVKNLKLNKRLKVVADASNGSAGIILNKIRNEIGEKVEMVLINCDPDGAFPAHGPDPTRAGVEEFFGKYVRINSADFGVVFDADGDRAVFFDNEGEKIRPEYVWRMMVYGLGIKSTVFDITNEFMMNRLLNQLYEENLIKIKAYESKIGRIYIPKIMAKYDVDFGFEYSGHYYFKDFWNTDSGLFAFLKMLETISKIPYSAHKFISLLPNTYRIPEIDVKMQGNRFHKIIGLILKKYSKLKMKYKISKKDGLSILTKSYWFNIRKSNTQDLIKINIEGVTEKRSIQIYKDIFKVINRINRNKV